MGQSSRGRASSVGAPRGQSNTGQGGRIGTPGRSFQGDTINRVRPSMGYMSGGGPGFLPGMNPGGPGSMPGMGLPSSVQMPHGVPGMPPGLRIPIPGRRY